MDMAPTSMPSPPPTSQLPSPGPPQPNLAHPLPLSATQEQQVRVLYYANVRKICDPEIKAFAACALNRTVTATWVCRQQRLAMNSCMVAHANPAEEDRAREQWFAGMEERRRKAEKEKFEVEERRREVIELIRMQEEKELAAEKAKNKAAGSTKEGGKGGGWWR